MATAGNPMMVRPAGAWLPWALIGGAEGWAGGAATGGAGAGRAAEATGGGEVPSGL
jgi:hypothetical protein